LTKLVGTERLRPRHPPYRRPAGPRGRVNTRGRIDLVRLDTVDWIESQGNYLALHLGGATHLVRDTLTRLEPQLDPARFVRVHRRAIVRIDRVDAMAPLSGGDAELRLTTGARVRVSRAHRERVRAALP
jgi:DNA-binding LytR/AlgR family response regulator